MRFIPFLSVLVLCGGLLFLGLTVDAAWLWGLLAAGPLALVGIADVLQRRDVLRRNYPIWVYGRYLLQTLGPFLRAYVIEEDNDGKPYSREDRTIVYRRARGEDVIISFGSELDFYGAEKGWIHHSIVPREKADDSMRIEIGAGRCKQPYSSSLLNVSAMSFGSLGSHAVQALNLAARIGNFAQDTGEGGYTKYHRRHGGDVIWELGTGYFSCRTKSGDFDAGEFAEKASDPQVKMVELKLSQGAKPGHGGVLPGDKVTREIAEEREVEAHKDCISPNRHKVFATPVELLEFIARLHELSGGKPAGFKLCIGHPWEFLAICKAMRETGLRPDFIVVDGAEGGTGAAPEEYPDHVGVPLAEGLSFVHNALVATDLRDDIRLGASGKVISGYSLARAMALGADWCNAARAFMFSVGCVQSLKCHTGRCPTGVTTHDPLRQRALVIPEKARTAAAYHAATVSKLGDIVASMGLAHPREIEPHHLYLRGEGGKAVAAATFYPRVRPGALLDDPDATPYADAWRRATADSFAPRH